MKEKPRSARPVRTAAKGKVGVVRKGGSSSSSDRPYRPAKASFKRREDVAPRRDRDEEAPRRKREDSEDSRPVARKSFSKTTPTRSFKPVERAPRGEARTDDDRPARKFTPRRADAAPRRDRDEVAPRAKTYTPNPVTRHKAFVPHQDKPVREIAPAVDEDLLANEEISEEPELVYGRQSVLSLLQSERGLNRIWILEHLRYDGRFLPHLDRAKGNGAVIDVVSRERLDQICDGGNHQGIAAQTAAYLYWELEELVTHALKNNRPVLVAAEGLEDPQNLGSLIRSCEAMGVHGLILPQRRAAGVTAAVAKVSAGALEHLPISRVVNLRQALERLQGAGFWIVGTAAEATKTIYDIDLCGPTVVVIGAEHKGLSLLTQKSCDLLASIPLSGKTPSLNAAVAGAVVLSELLRQRQAQRLFMDQSNTPG